MFPIFYTIKKNYIIIRNPISDIFITRYMQTTSTKNTKVQQASTPLLKEDEIVPDPLLDSNGQEILISPTTPHSIVVDTPAVDVDLLKKETNTLSIKERLHNLWDSFQLPAEEKKRLLDEEQKLQEQAKEYYDNVYMQATTTPQAVLESHSTANPYTVIIDNTMKQVVASLASNKLVMDNIIPKSKELGEDWNVVMKLYNIILVQIEKLNLLNFISFKTIAYVIGIPFSLIVFIS